VEDLLDLFFNLPEEIELHALMCFIRMGEMLSVDVAKRILPKLAAAAHLAVSESEKLAWLRRASVVDCSRTIEPVGI